MPGGGGNRFHPKPEIGGAMRTTISNRPPPASTWLTVFLDFAYIGATSFGGGSATISALRRTCIKRGWLDEKQFFDGLLLSRLTPGISIIAQVILIGRSVCGIPGMIAGLLGLLVPSVTITTMLAWLYEVISHVPQAQGPLHSVVAMAAGFTVALTIELLRDILKLGRMMAGVICFAFYCGLAIVIPNPLIVMGIAIAVALIVPGLFDTAEPVRTDKAQPQHGAADDEP